MSEVVEITALGAQGDGIAGDRFVPFTLPGERVRLRPTDDPHRALPADILTPSPDRVAPVCRHFTRCGGCTLQHMAEPALAAFKRDLVRGALAAEGIETDVAPTVTVPARSRRRLALGARRLKSGALIGLRAMGAAEIVGIDECPLATPALEAAIPRLAPLVTRLASRKGVLRLTLTEAPDGIDCHVEGAKPPAGGAPDDKRPDRRAAAQAEAARRLDLAALAEDLDLARLSVDGEVIAMRRPPVQPVGPARVLPPPGAFLQPSVAGERVLRHLVEAALGDGLSGADRVVDLFAGIGTFALPLSARAAVTAYELDAAAVEAMAAGWRAAAPAAGLNRLDAVRRNLFRRPVLAEELAGVTAAVIDPPFAGAEAQARALAAAAVPRIASVSCNPVSFARDARILLDGGYVLDRVTPVDQFRWSAHVELVGAFRRP